MSAELALHVVAPFVIGLLAAIINVVAGGGSLLTLPLLIEMGLSPQVANGTNRIGVLAQTMTSSYAFARRGQVPWRFSTPLLPASVAGALAGAWTATVLPADTFRVALAVLFLAMTVLLARETVRDVRKLRQAPPPTPPGGEITTPAPGPTVDADAPPPWWMHLAFLAVGFYGGFIQAGVGIVMLLVVHVAGGRNLITSNATKAVHDLLLTCFVLVVFALQGHVAWASGIALGCGGAVGGVLGVSVANRVRPWALKAVLTVAVLLAALRFAEVI